MMGTADLVARRGARYRCPAALVSALSSGSGLRKRSSQWPMVGPLCWPEVADGPVLVRPQACPMGPRSDRWSASCRCSHCPPAPARCQGTEEQPVSRYRNRPSTFGLAVSLRRSEA